MYAVVEAGGEQIRVSAGDTVRLEKMTGEMNSEVVMDKVLMISDEGKTVWGKPYITGASVKAEVVGEGKGEKILVLKTTPKKAHNKTKGHRQKYVTLKIKEIVGG
ncbi:MAG: 50S ribosomal protein L21 [Alphaproteobacteria bacterium]|uniref:Large ribosomal subunit protein bL21 n=1 Tax=Candidatus Nitrobium versatile TaxID=2884831 RepID=A0A953M2A2_9BACT|nr:50S ribosomal protein L21 [Candidatus Nitrobium versatile]